MGRFLGLEAHSSHTSINASASVLYWRTPIATRYAATIGSEHWVVVAGCGTVTIGGDVMRVERGSHVYIPRETKHRIANEGAERLVFVEIQFGDRLEEDDIVRVEDDYQRSTIGLGLKSEI